MVKDSSRQIGEWANPRTVIVLTLLFLGTLWFLVALLIISARNQSIDATGESLQSMSRAVEEQTQRQFDLAVVVLAACEYAIAINPARDPRDDPAFRKLIEGFRARTSETIDIRLVSGDDQMFDVLDKTTTPLAGVADRNYFQVALTDSDLFIGPPTASLPGGHHGLPIALRLQTPAHGIRFLLAVIDMTRLSEAYEDQRQTPGRVIALLRSDGTVLARAAPDEPALGQPIPGLALPGEQLASGRSGLILRQATAGRAREFARISPIPGFPLRIMVSEDYDEALAPWLKQSLWISLLALAVTVPLLILAHRSVHMRQALANRDARLQHLATTDGLTGASSRQHFVEALAEEMGRAKQNDSSLSVLLFNIDFFQRINDGYGHTIGDQALITFAAVARRCLRDGDLLGRLGGGEFSILLPRTRVGAAVLVAERIRREITEISIPTENGTVQFTASAGASENRTTDRSVDDLLKRAAQAVHDARTGGHDRVLIV